MSVRLICCGGGFALGFRCDGGCARPEIIALVLPDGWEPLRTEHGELLHRCGNCRFDLIVEPLIRDLRWRDAA
jgi:hypothetical protein